MSLRASAQLHETKRASSLHKGCPDRLSRHAPPKLKLDIGGLEPLEKKVNRSASMHVPGLCFRRVFFIVLRRESL